MINSKVKLFLKILQNVFQQIVLKSNNIKNILSYVLCIIYFKCQPILFQIINLHCGRENDLKIFIFGEKKAWSIYISSKQKTAILGRHRQIKLYIAYIRMVVLRARCTKQPAIGTTVYCAALVHQATLLSYSATFTFTRCPGKFCQIMVFDFLSNPVTWLMSAIK